MMITSENQEVQFPELLKNAELSLEVLRAFALKPPKQTNNFSVMS